MNSREHKADCIALAERLSEYLDGELSDELQRQVEGHFTDCQRCETFLKSLRGVKELSPLLREGELSEADLKRLAKQVKRKLEE